MPEALPNNSSSDDEDTTQSAQVELNQVELNQVDLNQVDLNQVELNQIELNPDDYNQPEEQNLQILYPPSDTQQSTTVTEASDNTHPLPENDHSGDSSSLASVTPPQNENLNSPPDFETAAQYKTLSNEDYQSPQIYTQATPYAQSDKYTNSAFDQTQSIQNTTPSSQSKQQVQTVNSGSRVTSSTSSSSLPNLTTKQRVSVLFLLFALNMCCYMDRSTIMALQHDVKKAFCLGDKEAGLLSTAFTFPYMFASLAAGVMGDRLDRKWVILFGSTIWVSSVILGSFVTTDEAFQLYQEFHVNIPKGTRSTWFPTAQLSKISSQFKLLLLSRAGVGIGDACLVTIGPTIIDDLFFEGSSQLKALTLFNMAIPVGSGVGYLFAVQGMSLAENYGWPLGYNNINKWTYGLRSTLPFSITVLVLIILFMPYIPLGWSRNWKLQQSLESPSESIFAASETSNLMKEGKNNRNLEVEEVPTIFESLALFGKNPTFVATTFGSTCCWFIIGAAQMWLLQMFVRRANENAAQQKIESRMGFGNESSIILNVACDLCQNPLNNGTNQENTAGDSIVGIYGAIVVISGIVGPLAAVLLSNKFKSMKNSVECDLCGWSQLAGGIFLFFTLQTVTKSGLALDILTWFFVGLAITTCSFNFALGVKIIMSIVRSTQKNFALGTYNLFGHLLGDGISGYMLGFVSDALANKESLDGETRGGRSYHCKDADEGDDESLQGTFETIRLSLYILVVVSVIGFFCFRAASQHYDEDEKKSE